MRRSIKRARSDGGIDARNAVSAAIITAMGLFFVVNAHAAPQTAPRVKPAAPGPQYAGAADHARLEIVLEAVKDREFDAARAVFGRFDDPVAESLAQWLYYSTDDRRVSIADADRFLDGHPEWPAVTRIQRRLEKRLTSTTPKDLVLALFQTREPVTGAGKLALARAQRKAGDEDAAILTARNAWVAHNMSSTDERALLRAFGADIRTKDHLARVDRLLWERQVTAARRVFNYLPKRDRRIAETRAAFLTQARRAPQLYEALPVEDRADSGVQLAAVRYYRRAREEPTAVAVARRGPTDPDVARNPDRWWSERNLLMRWALKEGRPQDAYAMAAGHALKPSTSFSEAEFNAGWIALRHLGDPERAETHFKALSATVTAPISVARGAYWSGRAAEAAGATARAMEYYRFAAQHVYTYYGQLAAEKLSGAEETTPFAADNAPTRDEREQFAARPLARALMMLSEIDAPRSFLVFAYHLDDRLQSPGEYKALAEITEGERAPHITVRAGKMAVRRGAAAPTVSYPLIGVPAMAAQFAPSEVILGLSRQESEFNPRAYSSAGARGVMQLMPATAQLTARKEGLVYSRSRLLDDPDYNMIVGSAHLSHLLKRYNGSYIMTFAAYNAGPHRVTQWVKAYGDPRATTVDPIDWVEQIPFSETRNYVQRVLENTQIYRARLTDRPIPGRLSSDLERGGERRRAGAVDGPARVAIDFDQPARIAAIAERFSLPEPAHTEPPEPVAVAALDVAAEAAEKAAKSKRRTRRRRGFEAPDWRSQVRRARRAVSRRRVKETQTEPAHADANGEPAPVSQDADAPQAPAPEAAPASEAPPTSKAPMPTADEIAAAPAGDTRAVRAAAETTGGALAARVAASAAPVSPAAKIAPAQNAAAAEFPGFNPASTAPAPSEPAAETFSKILEDIVNGVEPDQAAADQVVDAGASPDTSAAPRADETDLLAIANDAPVQDCETYRTYIARVDAEEAAAGDLNAGMLAELRSGGAVCR
ncbi:MAG: lytic transglycosylase domain-containing protein [Pseudomonadota bacterium]